MEALSETKWDLILAGTGLPQSLLALALSRSDKKILHTDKHGYYGGSEAALSLQDAEEWIKEINEEGTSAFAQASITKPELLESSEDGAHLGFSRSYSLALAPQLIYTRSMLLATLVSSKVYRQLDFLAVGSWWIFEPATEQSAYPNGSFKKIPSGREDVFADSTLDIRSKRSLIKFVRLAADPEAQAQAVQEHGDISFGDYLTSYHSIPSTLQATLNALTLSPRAPHQTKTSFALPRINRHLTSFGVFGTGFNAVIPKWGGTAEIAQVACRAGAVGGSVYMLGTDVQDAIDRPDGVSPPLQVSLSTEGNLLTHVLAGRSNDLPASIGGAQSSSNTFARSVSIVSAHLEELLPVSDTGPPPACSVVAFPHGSLADVPVYVMVHSSDTGECPEGQSVIYAQAQLESDTAFEVLDQAVQRVMRLGTVKTCSLLWRLQYLQVISDGGEVEDERSPNTQPNAIVLPEPTADLAFDDSILKVVKNAWERISGSSESFMQFEDREIGAYDEEDEQD